MENSIVNLDFHAGAEGMTVLDGDFDFEVLMKTIYQSHFVKKHIDFYQWQQEYVSKFIPHDVLIAAWGDFSNNKLHFDISSNIPEVHTQQLSNGCDEIAPLMTRLFSDWENNYDRWFFQEDFNIAEIMHNDSPDNKIVEELSSMSSVLVYGFRDKRGENDILYAFLNSASQQKTETAVLSMIMPHIDSALRNVECIPKVESYVYDCSELFSISKREADVMRLVSLGKSNGEIGDTLYISLNTVKNHLKSIFKKMGVSSRAEAVSRYMVENASDSLTIAIKSQNA